MEPDTTAWLIGSQYMLLHTIVMKSNSHLTRKVYAIDNTSAPLNISSRMIVNDVKTHSGISFNKGEIFSNITNLQNGFELSKSPSGDECIRTYVDVTVSKVTFT